MVPAEPIPDLVPEFTIEVLSPSNTRSEMLRKRKEFFLAGTQLFWIVDPNIRTLTAYSAPDVFETFAEPATVTAQPVLPDFGVSLTSLFARLPKPQ
jgi:Uma2 family endonuclease